ncbi:hypothetical protein MEQU1_003190 [Malassezia equina]|uniref:Uncharacterized protein n=1 Tax=Malassezia equina TaxID=1381935 RepID=A0AAF0J1H5_9BASI|nr:hypothetical protein MEQU1_003190 [Malassezia equina]
MSDAFPNPFGPPPAAEVPPVTEDELSRVLRESLAFEQDAAQRRQEAEEAQLLAAIRASEEEHQRQQRELEDQQRHVREAIESSRHEAFRDERRREAEAQRHAILEMEVMARSKREHEARMRTQSPPTSSSHPLTPVSRESASDIGSSDMEPLLWLRHRGSVATTESTGSTPPRFEEMPNPFAETSILPAPLPPADMETPTVETGGAVSAPVTAPANDLLPQQGRTAPTRPPPMPPVLPISSSDSHALPNEATLSPKTALEPEPTPSSAERRTVRPTHALSRYEALFGRHEEEWDEEASPLSEKGSSISVSPTQSSPRAEWPIASEPVPMLDHALDGDDDVTPVRETPPAVPTKDDEQAESARMMEQPSCDVPTPTSAPALEEEAHLYPPAYVPGQPALRSVQFGAAYEPYPLELRAPHGAVLYPTLDLSSAPQLPTKETQLRFPNVIELGEAQPFFVVRAYSWKVLLQALAWHGTTTIQASSGSMYLHVAFTVPKRADIPSFAAPSLVTLALGTSAEPAAPASSGLAASCALYHVPVLAVPLVAHPLALPTDLVTLAQSLFTAPQLSSAPALRELKQVIARHGEWLDARSHAMASRTHTSPSSSEMLELRLLSHQLTLLGHSVTAPDAVESEGNHRDALRTRMRRTLARWNSANVGNDEDLATWITPYNVVDRP